MTPLMATLYPQQFIEHHLPVGTVARSHKAIPQKDEPKVSPKQRETLKQKSAKEKAAIVASLQQRGFTTAAFISGDINLSIPAVSKQLKVLTKAGVVIRYKGQKQPAIYSLV